MKKQANSKLTRPVALITGGSGFLGQAITRELLKEKRECTLPVGEVRLFDARQPGHSNDRRVRFIRGDIRSTDDLAQACKGVDIIFHCAAVVDWGQNPRSLVHDVNVNGTLNVIAASRASGVRALVYTSTMDVLYGGNPIVDGDETLPYPEKPVMVYAETKAAAEQAVIVAGEAGKQAGKGKSGTGLRTCSIRPCGMFGEADPYHVSSCLKMVKNSKLSFRIGNGKARFQHVYVGNVAHAHVLAARSLLDPRGIAAGRIYLITDFAAKNFFDYLEPIVNGVGYRMPPKSRSIPLPVVYAAAGLLEGITALCRPFFKINSPMNRTSATMVCQDLTFSGERARRELGYRPVYTEEEAIARTVRYFKDHGPL